MENYFSSGRPSDAVSQLSIAAVRKTTKEDRKVKVSQIAEALGISFGRINNNICESLRISKLSVRWVPRNLIAHNQHQQVF